ncbi:MAG: NADH-quinone oxidoreductase subunit [Bacteroidota bacterium]|jgi:NADH-quinone oxidoreductase subunit L
MHQYIYLVPLFPLLGFIIVGLGRNVLPKSVSGWIASLAVLASFVVSVLIFREVPSGEAAPKVVELYPFIQTATYKINFSFQVDQLSTLFLLVITGIGFLIHMYSIAYMHEENQSWFAKYFAYLNLFVFSMLLLVLGSNFVIMFIGWEGVGLCSYLLIGYWYKKNDYTNAAKKAFIMNRIGDLGFLIAVFMMLHYFGTVEYTEVFNRLAGIGGLENTTGILIIAGCLFIGACGKSAQLPLFTWLPDAMAGPTPVSALIHAATMVTAGIYMIVRSNIIFSLAPLMQDVILIVGIATALVSATIATRQYDIKKVLAYSTVSQLGFMFIALGVGAYTAAVFHVITHAFFKALLFLGSGSVIHGMHHEQDIRKMGGLKKYMPTTHITFLIGCLAIAGIVPFSGFFSKDEIMMHVYNHGAYGKILWGVILLAAMLTAYYMFRLLYLTFYGKYRGDEHHHPHESPALMTVPLIVLAILSTIGGALGLPHVFHLGKHWLHEHLSPLYFKVGSAAHEHAELAASTEFILMGVAVVAAIAAILIARRESNNADLSKPLTGIAAFFAGKWFFDEAYDNSVVKPTYASGAVLDEYAEKKGIDGVVNGVGDTIRLASQKMRLMQSGMVGFYMFIMVLGAVALFAALLLSKQ